MIRKITAISIFLFVFFAAVLPAVPVNAKADDVNIYFFWSKTCPHCKEEQQFLEYYKSVNSAVKVYDYELSVKENAELLYEVEDKLNEVVTGVPFTVIGETTISGYLSDATTGKQIENAVQDCIDAGGCYDPVGELIGIVESPGNGEEPEPSNGSSGDAPESVDLPLFGVVHVKDVSLPVLTIMFGFLDGFNPCAMWALIFLISLLLGMGDKKRMWILGSVFIVTSAAVYYLFMAAWLNILLFFGAIIWIRALIGLIALVGGGYNLREFFTNKDDTCKVSQGKQRQKVFDKLKDMARKQQFFVALIGIVLLAAAVNMVELVCSAGLPAVYTSVLSMSDLSTAQYYLYLLLYDFVFMLDDLVVFFASMTTLQLVGLTTKYTRYSHLIGGILMVIIGIILIFKPSLLMFG